MLTDILIVAWKTAFPVSGALGDRALPAVGADHRAARTGNAAILAAVGSRFPRDRKVGRVVLDEPSALRAGM